MVEAILILSVTLASDPNAGTIFEHRTYATMKECEAAMAKNKAILPKEFQVMCIPASAVRGTEFDKLLK